MAYRLERDESVLAGLKRVVREEVESAGSLLTGENRGATEKKVSRDEAIHAARKSIKKVRALMRLVRAELGDVYKTENQRFRDIAGKLSEFRDAVAIIGTFDDLRDKFKDEAGSERLAALRDGLVRRKNETGGDEDVNLALGEAASALKKASKRIKVWKLETDGFEAIAPGLEKTYRAGQQALVKARKNARAKNYHELRKRVKDHWYHVRLLEAIWTDVMVGYEKSLKDLETWLGDDHNLFVLREKILSQPDLYGKEKGVELTLSLIDKYQKELRDNSLTLAERIYEETPREFSRRMRKLWKTWRHEPRSMQKIDAAEAKAAKQAKKTASGAH